VLRGVVCLNVRRKTAKVIKKKSELFNIFRFPLKKGII